MMTTRPLLCLGALLLLGVSASLSGCGGTEHGGSGTPPAGTATAAAEQAPGGAPGQSAGGAVPAAEQSPAAAPDEAAAAAPSPAPALPQPDLGYNAREGRALYRHYCFTCHGAEGHGDGFNAYNLDPKPRDLADPAFQAKRSDDDLVSVIRSGGGVAGLSTGMPPWGRVLKDRQIRNVVDYIRTLKGSTD
jgi:mono/diheme cytochrome c family protein